MTTQLTGLPPSSSEQTVAPNEPVASVPDNFFTMTLQALEEEMLDLSHTLDTLLPQTSSKVVQFISSQLGEGSTTLSRAFAMVSALRLKKSVLMVEAQHTSPLLLPSGQTSVPTGQELSTTDMSPTGEATPSPALSNLFHSPRMHDVFSHLKQRYDLVVIDSPPVAGAVEGLAIARHVDGVLLVVEAESTRWSTVNRVKDRLSKSGANILGVVLNKRRYYIPPFIYKLL